MTSNAISFTASSTLAGGIGAKVNVVLDGTVIGTTTVGSATETYTFNATLASGVAHDIQIQYTNDQVISGQDRNLSLQSISVNGTTISATSAYEAYHAPSQGTTFASDGTMNWNGTAEFKLPASLFPAQSGSTPAGFYVSTTGSDSGDGSQAHPFATLAKAVSAMEHSSTTKTTYLEGGTYYPGSTLNLSSADSGITIKSAPGATAVLDGKSSLSTLISLSGASGVTLQGLTFRNTGINGAAVTLSSSSGNHITGNLFSNTQEGVLLSQGSSNNTVAGNELDNSATSAIEVQNQSNGNTFDSNLINGTGAIGTKGGGIFLHGANNNVISHNQIENTSGIGIGIENWDSSTINVGNSVTDNILQNTSSSASSTDSGAIYMLGRSDVNTSTTISGNYISGSSAPSNNHIVGIYLDELSSGVTIRNNIVADTITHSLQIHGGSDVTVQNNIFDLGSYSGYAYGKDTAVLFQSENGKAMTGNSFTQNIITSTSSTPVAFSSIDGGNPTINDNFYMDLINSHFQSIGDHLTETNAQFGNAQFANQAAGNYALGSTSGAHSIGFISIDQSVMGLHPTSAHWYA